MNRIIISLLGFYCLYGAEIVLVPVAVPGLEKKMVVPLVVVKSAQELHEEELVRLAIIAANVAAAITANEVAQSKVSTSRMMRVIFDDPVVYTQEDYDQECGDQQSGKTTRCCYVRCSIS